MSNRRSAIELSASEVDDFLASARTLVLATIGADGQPHLAAMWFSFSEGRLLMWTYGKSQKALNIARDPRVTCLVEDGDTYGTLRGVSVVGRAVLSSRPDDVRRAWELSHRKYERRQATAADEENFARQAAKRVAIVVEPLRSVSWDHRKLPHLPPGMDHARSGSVR